MSRNWTAEEIEFIRVNCHHLKDEELAAAIARASGTPTTVGALRTMRTSLGIKKLAGSGRCEVATTPKPKAE